MTIKQTLVAARKLIELEHRHMRRGYAMYNGYKCSPFDKKADCFCSTGVIMHVTGTNWKTTGQLAYEYLKEFMDGSVILYNDTHTHTAVLRAWDRAIAAA